jgi:hypothetical protein
MRGAWRCDTLVEASGKVEGTGDMQAEREVCVREMRERERREREESMETRAGNSDVRLGGRIESTWTASGHVSSRSGVAIVTGQQREPLLGPWRFSCMIQQQR